MMVILLSFKNRIARSNNHHRYDYSHLKLENELSKFAQYGIICHFTCRFVHLHMSIAVMVTELAIMIAEQNYSFFSLDRGNNSTQSGYTNFIQRMRITFSMLPCRSFTPLGLSDSFSAFWLCVAAVKQERLRIHQSVIHRRKI